MEPVFGDKELDDRLAYELEIYKVNGETFNVLMENGKVTAESVSDFFLAHMQDLKVTLEDGERLLIDLISENFNCSPENVPTVINDKNNLFNLLCNLIVRNPMLLEQWLRENVGEEI